MYGLVRFVLLVTVAVAASAQQNTNVVFHLFTRTNPTQSQPLLASLASIMTSSFSITNPTFISIHTNGESVTGNFNAFFVPTHLQSGDVNVLAVDWSSLSQMYSQGVAEAPNCGAAIAQFMNLLINDLGYQASNVRLIGHGLGGHVAGIAARLINGNVPHVVALDPSLVGWTHNPHRLSPNAATVVEVLHTTAGHRGYDHPLGHIDFYPNGGSHQNGCGADVNCSHTLAYAFYAESVTASVVNANRFVGTRCTNYEEAITLRCAGSRDATFGGLESKTGITGIFMFLTNPSTPFARG